MNEVDELRVDSSCDDRSRRGFSGTASDAFDFSSSVSLLLNESPGLVSTGFTNIFSLTRRLEMVSLLRFVVSGSAAILSISSEGQADSAKPSP